MNLKHFSRLFVLLARTTLLAAGLAMLWSSGGLCATVNPLTSEPFKIIVTGVDGDIKTNIVAALQTPNGMVRDGKVEPTWARRFARQAPARVAKALEPFGFYNPTINTTLDSVEKRAYVLNVSIEPGAPVTVSKLAISLSGDGADENRLRQQIQKFPLLKGMPFRHDIYEEGKGTLIAAARALGYLDAGYSQHEVLIDPDKRQADIFLDLNTGTKFFFGEISFQGANDYPEKFLRRYLTIHEGGVYVDTELARTQANFLDADKFRNVKINSDLDQSMNRKVPVRIDLTPLPRFQLRPGIGYGTDTGSRASLRFKDINSFLLGHEIHTNLMVAELRQTLSGQYLVPLTGRIESLLAFSAEYNRENNDTFESTSLSTEASLTHGLAKGYKMTLFINLGQEEYEVGNEPTRSTSLIMPGVRLGQRQWRFDRPGRVHKGYAWQVEARGSSVTLGSDVSVFQGIIGGSTITSLPWQTKLILRAEGGVTIQDDFDDLPPSMRFFAGGDQSVRGYAYKSLGPKDSDGEVIGGKHMLLGSIELEKTLNNDWSFALFHDAGNAFDDFNDYELFIGAGVGLRRYTPIGPVKLDLARQFGGKDNSYRVHLSVGFGW